MNINKKDILNITKNNFLLQRYIILYCFTVVHLNKDLIKRDKGYIYILKALDRLINLLIIKSNTTDNNLWDKVKDENVKFLHNHLNILVKKYVKVLHTNKTKLRSKLSYSKRKIWKQKGTGRARIGSKNSPILRGGSVTFGPKGFAEQIKINKKLKKLLFFSTVLYKINDFIIFEFLTSSDLPLLKDKTILLLINNKNTEAFNMALEFRNYKNFVTRTINMVTSFDILKYKRVVISKNDLFELFNRFLL